MAACQTVSADVNHDDAPPRRGALRKYLETRGVVGRHLRPHVHVRLRAEDGTALQGTYLPGPSDQAPAVVLAHGFAAHRRKPSYARLADQLASVAHVLSLDLRGHGRSGGVSTLGDREALDVAAGAAWLRAEGHDWIAVVGASMGGTSALHAAARGVGVDAVVAISAPAIFRDEPDTEPMRRLKAVWESPVARTGMRIFLGVRLVAPTGWQTPPHPHELAGAIEVPVLVVHGEDDAYFPVSDAETLAEAARKSTLWVEPAGFGHAEDGFSVGFADRLGRALVVASEQGGFPGREELA